MDHATTLAHLRALLAERHPDARPAQAPALPTLSTGYPPLDALLPDGGLPRGALCELSGPTGGGRTALALRAVARLTDTGSTAAWIDLPGEFYPPAAAAAGVALGHLLGVTPVDRVQALGCCDLLLRFGAVPLVVLDLDGAGLRTRHSAGPRRHWARLHTLVRRGETTLLVLAGPRPANDPLRAFADLSLEAAGGQVLLRRSRGRTPGGTCSLDLLGADTLSFALHPALPGLGSGAAQPGGRP